jgi:drug/metabolite transporter (DMT)-like permease
MTHLLTDHTFGLLLVASGAVLEATGQICLKLSANRNHHGTHPWGVIKASLQNHWMVCGVLCFLTQALLFTLALTKLPLSIAFPAGSMAFVFVALLSLLLLRERVGAYRWLGIALIFAGVVLVSVRVP